MTLTIPRQPVLEVYAGGWRDVSTEVFQGGQVAINRAGADEQPQATPGTMSATMLNSTGNWSLDNPLGAYADYLDVGAPMRWSLRVARDAFGRSVVNDWGNAETGEVWHLGGQGGSVVLSDWQVNGSAGTQSVPTTSAYRFSVLWDQLYQDVEVRCTVTVPITDVTGGGIEPGNVFVRYDQASGNYYMARVTVSSAEAVTIGINTPAASLISPVTVTGLADAISTKALRVAIQAEGCTIRAKVYKPGPAGQPNLFEPVAWQIEVHDEQLPGLGGIGVRNGVASGNTNTKPIVFSCDDFDVRVPRYYGWLTRLTPVLRPGNQGQLATLLVSGRFMTMSQGTTPVLSPPRRLIQTTTALTAPPKAFWSLESGPLQQSCDPDVGPGKAVDYFQYLGAASAPVVGFGQGDLGPWVPPTVETGHNDTSVILAAPLPASITAAGQWIAVVMVRFNSKATTSAQTTIFQVSDPVNAWSVNMDGFAKTITPSGPVALSPSSVAETILFDGQPHVVWMRCFQNGGNATLDVFVDNREVLFSTGGPFTLTKPATVSLFSASTERQPVSWGYLAFFDDSGSSSDQPTFPLVYLGRVGETAGTRAQRLCQENGVPFAYLGDLTKTAPMGPQPTLGLLALLQQCADADRAVLLESRGSDGILFVCNNWLYNQTATATVDYSARQVHTLDLSPDDRGVFNDVTAERVYGSSYRTQRLTGPRNAQDPGTATGAIGRRDTRVSVNISSDARLPDIASYEVSRGCDGRSRVPSVGITLTTRSMPGQLQASLMALDVTDRLVLQNLREAQVFRDVDLYVRGYAETFDTVYGHKLTVNALPYEPLRGITFDDPLFRWDSDVSTLATAITGSPGTMSVQATDTVTLWSTAAADYPANVEVSVGDRPGEVITVSAVSGTTSPQTFTISARSVNGITRDWPIGAKVRLPRRSYWRLS